jgi:hypothetical protein
MVDQSVYRLDGSGRLLAGRGSRERDALIEVGCGRGDSNPQGREPTGT